MAVLEPGRKRRRRAPSLTRVLWLVALVLALAVVVSLVWR
jgi:hypothetical protein